LTLENLSRITTTDLKTGISSLDEEEDGKDLGTPSGIDFSV
jgi:hypothetical protein